MAAAAVLKIQKSRYLGGLTDRHEIWRGDAVWHYVRPLKIRNF